MSSKLVDSFSFYASPGVHPRNLELRLSFDPEHFPPVPVKEEDWPYDVPPPPIVEPEDHWRSIVACVEPGFFERPEGEWGPHSEARRMPRGNSIDCEISARLPSMSAAGVGSLVRSMTATLLPYALVGLDAREPGVSGPAASRVQDLPRLILGDVPFEVSIDRQFGRAVVVEIELEGQLSETSTEALTRMSRSWTTLVCSGAFPGDPSWPFSRGFPGDAMAPLSDQWIIRIDDFAGSPEVASPLLGALSLLHRTQPIASVLVRSG